MCYDSSITCQTRRAAPFTGLACTQICSLRDKKNKTHPNRKDKTSVTRERRSQAGAVPPAAETETRNFTLPAPRFERGRRVLDSRTTREGEAAKECEGAQKLEDIRNRAAVKK